MPMRVMSASSWLAFGVFVFGEQRGVADQAGSRRRGCCAPDSRRSRPCRRALASCEPRSVTRPSQKSTLPVTNAWSETRSSPLASSSATWRSAGADAVAVACSCARRRWRAGACASLASTSWCCTSPDTMNVLGELVARVDAGAARARVGGELLVDAEAALGLARPGARFEMLGGVFAFDQPGGRRNPGAADRPTATAPLRRAPCVSGDTRQVRSLPTMLRVARLRAL